ncbi:hypothetical protein LOTGIDRAFT_155653 [Lottia gigantea]|uniref:Reverse transcriptase domain-containing protein n=1 Tax=Lottia gigantea TaxID=225164 RepID=V4B2J2_LOTGI|nr:hypothetical protein LOTGIDRAFT_155653 [Lottia gigantea]ESO82639.1 hypothetical protein LOTGIDRAFT_155653 [Lottia gigantea]
MGLRSNAIICQRTTSSIRYMFGRRGFQVVNYLDDFGGAETPDRASEANRVLGDLLKSCGIEEAPDKAVFPTTRMVFLCVSVDTQSTTMEVTPERVSEILALVESWLTRKRATLKDLQSLLGKLHFICNCVRPGRIFVSRLLNWLPTTFNDKNGDKKHSSKFIPAEIRKDLLWWKIFLSKFNGVSIMSIENWSAPDQIFACYACPGLGGFCNGEYIHGIFPTRIAEKVYI